MNKNTQRISTTLTTGLGLIALSVSLAHAQQPTVNPGIMEQRIIEDKRPRGIIVDINPYFTEGSTRSDVIQGRIQREGIREGKNTRRNIFQRFFDRFQ